MSAEVYLQPIATVIAPQAEDVASIRLGGSLVYATRFSLILREDGFVSHRWVFGVDEAERMLAEPTDALTIEAQRQWHNLQIEHQPLKLGTRRLRLDQPQIMGILNVTPDSFSDGGHFEAPSQIRERASAMVGMGAAIIDIGGESTRPDATPVLEDVEIERVRPAVEYCAQLDAAISLDTRRKGVLEAGLAAGAHMLNDISSMRYDPAMFDFVVESDCPVVLMHAPGKGENPHEGEEYSDVVGEVFDFLKLAREKAIVSGIAEDRIVIDPGIGFGKSLRDNLALLNALPLFHALGSPLLVGASRKRVIGMLSNEDDPAKRLGGSVAIAIKAMDAGAHIIRAHDVFDTVQARNVWRGMRDAALSDFSTLPGA